MKDTARIIQWDRSGAIVTEAIKYNESPLLIRFFCCYLAALPDMHGKDQSVLDPMLNEVVTARKLLNLTDAEPLVKVSIPCEDGSLLYHVAPAP